MNVLSTLLNCFRIEGCMLLGVENRADWFRIILELLRYAIFVGFYFLSIRMVFVTLTHTTPVVSMVVGSVAVVIAILALWKIEWALYGFVICIPIVSGLQVIGFMKALPLLSVGFASIFLVWLPKKWVLKKENLVPGTGIGSLVDVLSGIVLLSLTMVLIPYPLDFVFSRVWCYPFVGQDQPFYGIDGSYVILQGLFFYRVMELEIREKRIWKWLLPVIYVQSLIIMGFSLFQWVYGVPRMHWGRYGIKSPFDDIHSYGSYVVVLLFLFLVLSFRDGRIQRWVNGAFAGIFFVLLIWSGGNGTLMAMLVTGIAFLSNTLKKKYFIVIASFLAIGAVCIIAFPSIITKSDYQVIRRYHKSLDITNISKGLSSRFLLWHRAVGIIEEFPITGAGIGTFYRISPLYQDQEVKEWRKWADWHENTHNYYLQFGAELGIPALLIFLGVIFYTYRAGFDVLRETRKSTYLAKGLLFGLSAYLITMLTSHPLLLSNQQFLFWFVIAVISVAYRFGAESREHNE
ncbi:MAG: O-antigen ligase family protein [Thermoplasmatales archaeon]|nr:O-antigen ligase family protein [Thermoplasmatales archaeon]